MAERTTFERVGRYVTRLRREQLPALFREVATDVLLLVGKLGSENLSGRFYPRNTKNSALALWFQRALQAEVDYGAGRITTGVPASHQFGRIIALQEEGGTIVPRKRKYLRIPRPIAMLPSGFERDQYSWMEADGFHSFSLHDAIGTPRNPFFVLKTGGGALARRRGGKKSSIEVWYDLKKSQTVESRESVGAAVQDAWAALPAVVKGHLQRLEATA